MNNLLALLLVSAVARADLTSQLEEEERTLGDSQEKSIQYKSAGDYTLVSIPWSGSTSLSFNDSNAATISAIGNAALLVGGLYLLSGFPTALARSDPFGVQRRFGKPAPPAKMYKPRGEEGEERAGYQRRHRQRGVQRRGPARQPPAEERSLPSLPTFSQSDLPQERQFNLPRPGFSLPSLRPFQLPRMPSLSNIRLPSFPRLGGRPRPARPQPAPQSSRPAPPSQSAGPAPAPQSPRPSPPQISRPVAAPQPPQPAQPAPSAPLRVSPRPQPIIPPVQNTVQQQTAPVDLPDPRPAAPSDFGNAFDTDPFQEFQSSNFGGDQSFQDLISEQFGDSFEFKKL